MSRLTVTKTSEAQAIVQEAEALEWETRRETDRWFDEDGEPEGFEASQARYGELRGAAKGVVAILYDMQEPLLDDPYSTWASKLMIKAKALLVDIEEGELVEKTSFVLASSEKE
jgi:hypothetical protein